MKRVFVIVAAALALAACQPKASPPKPADETAQSEVSKAFMDKVAKEEGVKVLPSGLAYKVISSGPPTGLKPQLTDEVKVHYEGTLEDGHVFDSSYDRGSPVAMPLRGLIPAWQQVLPMMRPGDVWMIYVPSNLGYGEQGAGGGEIPPGAPLIFKIELIDVLPGPGRVQQG